FLIGSLGTELLHQFALDFHIANSQDSGGFLFPFKVVFNAAILPLSVSFFSLVLIVFLNIVFEMFIVPLVDCCSCFRRFIILIKLSFAEYNILVSVINIFIMFNVLLNARITVLILGL